MEIPSIKTAKIRQRLTETLDAAMLATLDQVVRDATKVLKTGDVIWVSRDKAAPAKKTQKKSSGKNVVEAPEGVQDTVIRAHEPVIALRLQQYPDVQGAMVSIEPQNGDVVAMIPTCREPWFP